jgi:haloalkane dehalogenase
MATDRTIDVAGARLHYVDDGAGPVILMLHGNPTSSFLYRHVIAGLRDRFRCVALDYPGFGRSVAPAGYGFTPREHSTVVEQFVDALGLRALTVFVQDWGGPIGLGFAGRRPELVHRLVLGNTWAWPVNGDLHFEYFSRLVGGPIGRFFILRHNAFVNVLIPAGVKRSKLTPEVMAAYRAPFPTRESRLPTAIFPREILASRAFLAEVEAGLARLRALPVLILWGTKDIAFRAKERERLERAFANHRTVILEGAGHYIQEDAPEEIVRAIGGWS